MICQVFFHRARENPRVRADIGYACTYAGMTMGEGKVR